MVVYCPGEVDLEVIGGVRFDLEIFLTVYALGGYM